MPGPEHSSPKKERPQGAGGGRRSGWLPKSLPENPAAPDLIFHITSLRPLGRRNKLLRSEGQTPLRGDAVIESQYNMFQFRSVAQSCLTLCYPMDCSTPGLPVHHQLPEFTQTHVHGVGDAIQPSHPLSSPSPPTFNLSQHQGLFK